MHLDYGSAPPNPLPRLFGELLPLLGGPGCHPGAAGPGWGEEERKRDKKTGIKGSKANSTGLAQEFPWGHTAVWGHKAWLTWDKSQTWRRKIHEAISKERVKDDIGIGKRRKHKGLGVEVV